MSLETLDAEIIVVGGGAAGLTAAQYGARANLKTLLIEEMAPGGQALIIDDLENYPGFPEKISGFDFTQRFTQQALNFGAEITNATVNSIKKEGNVFVLDTTKGEKKDCVHGALPIEGKEKNLIVWKGIFPGNFLIRFREGNFL